MGENEQGGMLRVVVVLGLIAIIAMTVIYGVTQMKAPITNARNNTVVAMQKVPVPVPGTSKEIHFKKWDSATEAKPYHAYYLPDFGALAPKHWETIRIYLTALTDIDATTDTNLYDRTIPNTNMSYQNDDDDVSKRQRIITDSQGNQTWSTLKAGESYMIQISSYNHRDVPLYHLYATNPVNNSWQASKLVVVPNETHDQGARIDRVEYAQYGDESK